MTIHPCSAILIVQCILCIAPLAHANHNAVHYDFSDLDAWIDASQKVAPSNNYMIISNRLHIYTQANSKERAKVKTRAQNFGPGRTSWRVYVPAFGVSDQAGIGAFLFHDCKHEIDFEIGYGKKAHRSQLGVTNTNELLVFMTAQSLYPDGQKIQSIRREQWYTFQLDLSLVGPASARTYRATWLIDNQVVHAVNLDYGPEIEFAIFCSLENLSFLGDKAPSQKNYALFDTVTFTPYK